MYESPRDRRLKTDFQALQRLKNVSSIIDFKCFDNPPQRYLVTFKGKGLHYNKANNQVEVITLHRVEIRLGASYPRNKPELKWKTPIFHPNISALGQVCLGGYGTNWVPSLNLDELCEMLWDMIRFANFDTKSPYNYKAARWVEQQTIYQFPLDHRSLRDQLSREKLKQQEAGSVTPEVAAPPPKPPEEDIVFIMDDGAGDEPEAPAARADTDIFYIGDD